MYLYYTPEAALYVVCRMDLDQPTIMLHRTNMCTHLTQVDLYDLVVFTAIIWHQVLFEVISQDRNI